MNDWAKYYYARVLKGANPKWFWFKRGSSILFPTIYSKDEHYYLLFYDDPANRLNTWICWIPLPLFLKDEYGP
jgi:hypothetical protein